MLYRDIVEKVRAETVQGLAATSIQAHTIGMKNMGKHQQYSVIEKWDVNTVTICKITAHVVLSDYANHRIIAGGISSFRNDDNSKFLRIGFLENLQNVKEKFQNQTYKILESNLIDLKTCDENTVEGFRSIGISDSVPGWCCLR